MQISRQLLNKNVKIGRKSGHFSLFLNNVLYLVIPLCVDSGDRYNIQYSTFMYFPVAPSKREELLFNEVDSIYSK